MLKRWTLLNFNSGKIESLKSSLNISSYTICQLLTQRGIDTYEEAKQFFRPQLSQLHSPWLMKDMEKAVNRISNAIKNNEKILVFGDYDVDGTTSVACMYQFLKSLHPLVDYYIPHRYKEGYGVSKLGIDWAKSQDISLIISLDCGIKSTDLIAYAKNIDIDFIVCDHHLPDNVLPPAVAILNPKQKNCSYPFKELCGCGVGFKLMTALSEHFQLPEITYQQYLDLVATAIAADIVSLAGENRILAFYGLKKVNENPNCGIKALMHLAKVEKKLSINNLVFIIAPRINAAGRMDDAKKAVQLFIEKNPKTALTLAELLQDDNSERKEADSSITEEALNIINQSEELRNRKTTVLYQPHWHKGVVGIVASRLIEKYYRPTIVLTKSGDIVAGSARSVAGFNLYEAVHACKEHLLGYGGHFAAAGMTLEANQVENFSNAFEKVVTQQITEDQLIPEIVIDAEIDFSEINMSFYNILSQMEPFGPDNMRPVFVTRKVKNTGFSRIVKNEHIRFSVLQKNTTITGIGFNLAHKMSIINSGEYFDIVYTLDLNEFNGEKSLQIRVIDIKESFN